MLLTLTVDQYMEVMDSRIILGINGLFYLTSLLPVYISLCHITLFHVSDDLARVGNLMIVINSSLKLPVYLCLSKDFRLSVRRLFLGPLVEDGHYWQVEEDKSRQFLSHVKAASFALTSHERRNVCFADE